MPSLVSAKTALSLRGTPGPVTWRDTSTLSSSRPYVQTFTRLGLGGFPRIRYGSFTRSEASDVSLEVSDTASISATEEPVDTQEIASTDTARLSLTESSQLFNFIAGADTTSLSLSETVNLNVTGVTSKTGTDTASLTLTESVAISVTIGVTDTATLDSSDAGVVATPTEVITGSDVAGLSIDDSATLNVFTGLVNINVEDAANITGTALATAVEVRRTRLIALELLAPRIELEMLY